jgi:hypothetical protein
MSLVENDIVPRSSGTDVERIECSNPCAPSCCHIQIGRHSADFLLHPYLRGRHPYGTVSSKKVLVPSTQEHRSAATASSLSLFCLPCRQLTAPASWIPLPKWCVAFHRGELSSSTSDVRRTRTELAFAQHPVPGVDMGGQEMLSHAYYVRPYFLGGQSCPSPDEGTAVSKKGKTPKDARQDSKLRFGNGFLPGR